MKGKRPPLLRVSSLTGRVAILLRYTERDGVLIASERHFVPDEDFERAIREYRLAKRRRRR